MARSVLIAASSVMTWRSNGTPPGVVVTAAAATSGFTASTLIFQSPIGLNGAGRGNCWTTEMNPDALSLTIGSAPPGGVTVSRNSARLGHMTLNATLWLVVEMGIIAE